jgi:ABC-type branched-subunit amino acid transport system ATPase component
MSWFNRNQDETGTVKHRGPVLVVDGLDVYYGRAHALQAVSLTLDRGVLGIVGRNGMGKTTLCNAITGLVPAHGSVKLFGEELLGRAPNEITKRGIAYVPQGRRVWPSLSVEETLRLVAARKRDVDRIYAMFPRLAERRGNGGAQLSGGEQQMLAIGRILRTGAKLLLLDEPTEGLAPVIVQQIEKAIRTLKTRGFTILLVEQNSQFAAGVAERHYIVEHGRVVDAFTSAEFRESSARINSYLAV